MNAIQQKRDPRRNPLPYMSNVRLSDPAYRGALMLARARGVPVTQVIRDALDRELARFTNSSGQTFLEVLKQDESIKLAVDELADLVAEDGSPVA